MSSPPSVKRQKTGEASDTTGIAKVLRSVPSICAFMDLQELLALRSTSHAWKDAADYETMTRATVAIMKARQNAERSLVEELPSGRWTHTIDLTLQHGSTKFFSGKTALAESALEFAKNNAGIDLNVDTNEALNTLTSVGAFKYHGKHIEIEVEKDTSPVHEKFSDWLACAWSIFPIQDTEANSKMELGPLRSFVTRNVKVLLMPAAALHFQWEVKKSKMNYFSPTGVGTTFRLGYKCATSFRARNASKQNDPVLFELVTSCTFRKE